jgi:hypothetical protein
MIMSKKTMAATLLLAAGYAGLASAHTQSGTVGLANSGLAKTDIYVVHCIPPATKLFVHVKDLAPVKLPVVSIQAIKGGSSPLSNDAVDGDANYSPVQTLAAGSGDYTMSVNKSAYTGTLAAHKGPETYIAEFHCQNASGSHTDTTWDLIQNQ